MATWSLIFAYFDALKINGLRYSFFLEAEKLIMAVKKGYKEAAARYFSGCQFQIVTGT